MKKLLISLMSLFITSSLFFIFFFSNSNSQTTINPVSISWQYSLLDYSNLHKISTGKTQTIALIDSGVSDSQISENDISLIDENVLDENGHGTMMYSIIKGYKNQILGISPDVDIVSIKILDEDESIKPTKISEAINLAINKNVTIINLSVASNKYNENIADAIKKANEKNITIISSSGNYSETELMFPANMKEVISVGAIDKDLKPLEMTSGHELTTINAPGDNIETLGLNNEIIKSSGTSQATALISGYVALIKDYAVTKQIELNNSQIIKYLNMIKNGEKSYYDILQDEIN
ncbi:S8 family peptidase [Niallia sp. MER TA 168]|uniref:S8 family peptidase n=1 Tax=Niallia sp. MER TA 168 TaxID=2939568 RepID=UPI00203AF4F8|nr:S8 family serine peptidase [Niallia sp. MER TA 168]MCM3362039.1 S8 family serine peptidase [Niallia sp. MER TA 168]